MAASSVGSIWAGWPPGLVAPVDQRTDPVAAISPDPGMHALAGHPITLGHLGDRDLGLENLHDCLVALLHDAQLHQHRSPPLPSTNQTVRVQPEEKCQASSGARVSSIKRNPASDQGLYVGVLLYCFKPPSLEPAAAPPARPGGRGLRLSWPTISSALSPSNRGDSKRVQAGRWTAGHRHCEVLGWVETQPSRVRSAGLRPPLTAARCRVPHCPRTAQRGCRRGAKPGTVRLRKRRSSVASRGKYSDEQVAEPIHKVGPRLISYHGAQRPEPRSSRFPERPASPCASCVLVERSCRATAGQGRLR